MTAGVSITQRHTHYSREQNREGKLPLPIKFYQAIGALPDTFKNFAFNTFLLLLYNQIMGLPASLASMALMIAIVFDAITDPIVGSYSDSLRSRMGRRHPLMFASVLPLSVCLYLLLQPPSGLGTWGLFCWLLSFAILTRGAMTLFLVPWSAMFAELSDDYIERSSIITWRYVVGALGGVIFVFCTWTFIFPSTEEYAKGQLNPAAYELFAPIVAIAVGLFAWLTSYLTLNQVPFLRQPDEAVNFGLKTTVSDLLAAMHNRNFMVLFGGLLVSSILTGTIAAFEIYFHTYFWEFSSEELRWLTIGMLGALLGAILIPVIQKRLDKKTILLASMIFSLADGLTIISLRLLGILPDNGDPLLLQILVVNEIFRMTSLTVTVIMFISMVADTLDEQELDTGLRQEGVFSAAISFSGKAVSGFGVLATGFLLDYAIGFPQNAQPGLVDHSIIIRLGIIGGLIIPALYIIPYYLAHRYRISRERQAEIRAALNARA